MSENTELPTPAHYATQHDLDTAAPAPIPVDILDAHLHKFFVAYQPHTKPVGVYLILNPAGGYVLGGKGELAGYNLSSTAGGTLVLHDGVDKNAPALLTVTLPANGNTVTWLLPGGIHYTSGLYAEITGQIIGALYPAREVEL